MWLWEGTGQRYSTNTNFSGRWGQIFSHKFVQLIWLRERGFYEEENLQHKQTYIPKRVTNGESCFCGFEIGPQEQKCHYCSHKHMDQIEKTVKSQCPQIWTKQRHKSKNQFCLNFAHRLALARKQTDRS